MGTERKSPGEALTDGPPGASGRRSARGYLMLAVAFVTCPCHLPILAAVLAGTAAGAYLKDNFALAFVALTGIFILALLLGLRWSNLTAKGRH